MEELTAAIRELKTDIVKASDLKQVVNEVVQGAVQEATKGLVARQEKVEKDFEKLQESFNKFVEEIRANKASLSNDGEPFNSRSRSLSQGRFHAPPPSKARRLSFSASPSLSSASTCSPESSPPTSNPKACQINIKGFGEQCEADIRIAAAKDIVTRLSLEGVKIRPQGGKYSDVVAIIFDTVEAKKNALPRIKDNFHDKLYATTDGSSVTLKVTSPLYGHLKAKVDATNTAQRAVDELVAKRIIASEALVEVFLFDGDVYINRQKIAYIRIDRESGLPELMKTAKCPSAAPFAELHAAWSILIAGITSP